MNTMNKKRSETFNEIAELYHRMRPSYPDELVEAVIQQSGLTNEGKIVEVGSGTGNATLLFAAKGYSILCLEPGANLAAVARENLRDYPNVSIETVKFEYWSLKAGEFDLLISAQAFHWIDPAIKYVKAAQALKKSGWMALFWNLRPDSCGGIFEELNIAYQTHAPMIAQKGELKPFEARVQEVADEMMQSGYFKNVLVQQFAWSRWYNTRDYLALLETHSDHRILPAANKRALFDAIADILRRHGGGISKPYVAVLYLAQRK